MSDDPRPSPPRTASYEADPEQVHRVLLLYSGGLDTSVMLKWIQDRYDAEVVCLTVNLGQPGEDYAVIEEKARRLGALECHVVDAREQFAREFLVPAIRANAVYGGGYPLFTALGRPLIAQLAVEYARRGGCDTIAHGCTGKGNDQVRIEATVATLGPELKVIAPVRSWQMGREEEIAYAREHGIPVKGGTETIPYSIDDNLWGRSSEGRWISWSAARGFGLRDRGLVAPGYLADFLLLDDLESCAIHTVFRRGTRVSGETFVGREMPLPPGGNTVRLQRVTAETFRVAASGASTAVIGIIPNKILTEHLTASLPYRDGLRHADPEHDLLKVCVLERHGRNGNIGRGFVRGFGFRSGALASSVGHDSHNICVVGVDDADMAIAVNRLAELGGGLVAVAGGRVLAELALPFAGLMSLEPYEVVGEKLSAMRGAVTGMGCRLAEPFLHLAFLALPVIPHLKITDRGLVDVDRFELIAQ